MTKPYMKKFLVFVVVVLLAWPLLVNERAYAQNEPPPQFSRAELAQMLAPIALYPDALLSQVLIAASYSFEVVEAQRWLAGNPYLAGQALDDALWDKDWDVSILALCHYPNILTMMAENLSWTARLGDAFIYQEQDVMDMVQRLRARARARGRLTTTAQLLVIVEGNMIRIEPADVNYLYIPVYDSYYVYGTWRYPDYPPFAFHYPGIAPVGARIVFSPSIYLGFGFFGWSTFNWMDRRVVVVDNDKRNRSDRYFHGYKEPPRVPWRPDDRRRMESRKRAPEIPPFRPTAKPSLRVRERDIKKGGGFVVPPINKPVPPPPAPVQKVEPKRVQPVPSGPRVIDRQPDIRPRAPEKAVPPPIKPPVMDQKKPAPTVPSPAQTTEPRRRQPVPLNPRLIDKQPDIKPSAPEKAVLPQIKLPVMQQNKPAPSVQGPIQPIEPKRSQPVPLKPRVIDSQPDTVQRTPIKAGPPQGAPPVINQPKTAPPASDPGQHGKIEGKQQRIREQDDQKKPEEEVKRQGGKRP
jgi:hypothetical protein